MKGIKKIIKQFPNDSELGSEVRKRSKMIKQRCKNCGKKFRGNVKFDICPSCYV